MLTPIWKDTLPRPSWSPWRELRSMQRDLDRLFEGASETASGSDTRLPTYEVEETEHAFLVSVELPGVRPEDTKVSVKDGRLEIFAQTKTGGRDRKFQVAFTLPTDVVESKLEASLEHGVLALLLPKAAKPEAREIPVKVGRPHEGSKPSSAA